MKTMRKSIQMSIEEGSFVYFLINYAVRGQNITSGIGVLGFWGQFCD